MKENIKANLWALPRHTESCDGPERLLYCFSSKLLYLLKFEIHTLPWSFIRHVIISIKRHERIQELFV